MVLFIGDYAVETGTRSRFYGVTPDGQQFPMVRPKIDVTRINVILNWFEELKQRVPTGR